MSTAAMKSPPKFTISKGSTRKAHRTLIYGVGGIGKTSLGALLPGIVFIDLEGGASDIDVPKVEGITSWSMLLAALNGDTFNEVRAIGIDSLSKADEMCREHLIETIPLDSKGGRATSIESYGFGKGYVFLLEEYRKLLGALERHYQAGRDIVLIAHDNIGKTPNPTGDDYIRHEPRLTHSEKSSVRSATVEWCDHVLFIDYDVNAQKESKMAPAKGVGIGSRTIYTAQQATHVAKSRTLAADPIVFKKGDSTVWSMMRQPKVDAPEL